MNPNINPVSPIQPDVTKPKIKFLNLFLILGIIGVLLVAAGLAWVVVQKYSGKFFQKQQASVPEWLNDYTNEYAGSIKSINGDELTISENGENKISFKLRITPETKIMISPASIPYLTKLATPSGYLIKSSDLKVGQRIGVVAKEKFGDPGKTFELVSISGSLEPIILGAIIDEIPSESTLKVTVSPPALPEVKHFTLLLDENTEIVKSGIYEDSTKLTKKTQLPFSSFKLGQQIVIYTDQGELNSTEIKVQKVDIIPPQP